MGSSVVPTFTTCAPKRFMYSFKVSPWYCFTSNRSYEISGGALFARYCSLNSWESCAKDVIWPSERLMNQSMAMPVKVLMKSLHLTASEQPTSIICVWNAVRCASGSSIPVKVTLGPTNVLGFTASRIDCENGVENSLGGVKHSRSSASHSPKLLRNPRRNSSFVRQSSSFLAWDAARSACMTLAQPSMPPLPPAIPASYPWPAAWSCPHSQCTSNFAWWSSSSTISWNSSNCYGGSNKLLRWKWTRSITIGVNLVKLKNERLKLEEDEESDGNSNWTDEQSVKTEFNQKTNGGNHEQRCIFSKLQTKMNKRWTELNFTMNCGSWTILENRSLRTATEKPLTLAVGANVLNRPHGGRQMFLPVDRESFRVRLWLANKDSFVFNSDLHPTPLWAPENEVNKRAPSRPFALWRSSQQARNIKHLRIGAP